MENNFNNNDENKEYSDKYNNKYNNQHNKKYNKRLKNKKPVYKADYPYENNTGYISNFVYECEYEEDEPIPPTIEPTPTPKPDECYICKNKNTQIYWTYNPITLEKEKIFSYNWFCFTCIMKYGDF